MAEVAGLLRARLDQGELVPALARRRLHRWSLAWLARFAADPEVVSAFEVLRRRGFEPPRPVELPTGTAGEIWCALEARSGEELTELAARILDLPAPGTAAANAVMELLLAVPGETARARRLCAALEASETAGQVALWRLRLDREAGLCPPDAAAWEGRLAAFPSGAEDRGPLATAHRLAASAVIGASDAFGAHWLCPVLGGRRLGNAALALLRRPALAHELGPALEWLARAETLSPGRAEGGLEGLVSAAEAADARGDHAEANALYSRALARSGERADLAHAVAMRAEILLDPGLRDGLGSALVGLGATTVEISGLARREIRPPNLHRPDPPNTGWAARVHSPGPERELMLAFLEAAGSRARAFEGWLEVGGDAGLLQATRLALDPGGAEHRPAVLGALQARVVDDETILAANDTEHQLARALWQLLPEGAGRALLRLRLAALEPDEAPLAEAPREDPDDPHSLTSRLAAASDLADAGHAEAAAAILVALLRREKREPAPPLGFVARLAALTLRLLRLETPPLALVGALERALVESGALALAVETALAGDPAAAYALHQGLRKAALEADVPDARRVAWLQIWLGIWRATKTPPTPAALRPFMGAHAGLVALAAARLSGGPDPVGEAAAFLAAHPPATTPAEAWSRLLLG